MVITYTYNNTEYVKEGTSFAAPIVAGSVALIMAENQNYTLRSSNEEVLTINESGYALSKKIGTSIVTATSEDGNYEASIAINVVIPVESIKIVNPEEKQITIGSSSFLINYEIMPSTVIGEDGLFGQVQTGFVLAPNDSTPFNFTTNDGESTYVFNNKGNNVYCDEDKGINSN